MTEFDQVFDGDLAQRAFLVMSTIFAIMYATAVIFMSRGSRWSGWKVFRRRTVVTALLVALGVSVATAGVFGFRASTREPEANASVSVMQLQSKVDMKALPELQMGDAF